MYLLLLRVIVHVVCQSKLPWFNYKRPEGALLFEIWGEVNTAVALNFVLVSTIG